MLPKHLRLRHKAHFNAIFNEGKSFSGKHVVIYIHPGERKYGFIASKKVGNAVQRNRAKRLMREAVRLNYHKIKDNVQIIFIAKATIKGLSYKEVEQSLLQVLKKARLLIE